MLPQCILVFDIETVPDIASGKKLWDLGDLDDRDALKAMQAKRLQKTKLSDFMPLHLHKIVAISAVLRTQGAVKLWSIGEEDSSEAELVERFLRGLERFEPTIISWNGAGFDLPVIHYRSLLHGISAPHYWEIGQEVQSFRWSNYLNRYHWRHIDLMDVLSGFQPRAWTSLQDITVMLGLPGKMGMDGSRVWDAFNSGQIKKIRDYCEVDVLNTYLVYLRFELMRGHLSGTDLEDECKTLREMLADKQEKHLQEFLERWSEITN
ncbi:MAG: 3'-5' exonuclease [Acidiferrobacteraceae bacterium]|nr:3'-5' exonuclease [Acidiferrobacteraceae bacterium]